MRARRCKAQGRRPSTEHGCTRGHHRRPASTENVRVHPTHMCQWRPSCTYARSLLTCGCRRRSRAAHLCARVQGGGGGRGRGARGRAGYQPAAATTPPELRTSVRAAKAGSVTAGVVHVGVRAAILWTPPPRKSCAPPCVRPRRGKRPQEWGTRAYGQCARGLRHHAASWLDRGGARGRGGGHRIGLMRRTSGPPAAATAFQRCRAPRMCQMQRGGGRAGARGRAGYSPTAAVATPAQGSPELAPLAGPAAVGCARAGARFFRLRPPLPRQRWKAPCALQRRWRRLRYQCIRACGPLFSFSPPGWLRCFWPGTL